jgi:hypothetical protein
LAEVGLAWPHRDVLYVRLLHAWGTATWVWKFALRWVTLHTGVPALVVAAVMLVVGWRILKRSARLAMEVALVTALLLAATELGWIHW